MGINVRDQINVNELLELLFFVTVAIVNKDAGEQLLDYKTADLELWVKPRMATGEWATVIHNPTAQVANGLFMLADLQQLTPKTLKDGETGKIIALTGGQNIIYDFIAHALGLKVSPDSGDFFASSNMFRKPETSNLFRLFDLCKMIERLADGIAKKEGIKHPVTKIVFRGDGTGEAIAGDSDSYMDVISWQTPKDLTAVLSYVILSKDNTANLVENFLNDPYLSQLTKANKRIKERAKKRYSAAYVTTAGNYTYTSTSSTNSTAVDLLNAVKRFIKD